MTEVEPREIIVEQSVAIPMRDGVRLYADIWRPDTDEQLPVLVTRTPYNRAFSAEMGAGEKSGPRRLRRREPRLSGPLRVGGRALAASGPRH